MCTEINVGVYNSRKTEQKAQTLVAERAGETRIAWRGLAIRVGAACGVAWAGIVGCVVACKHGTREKHREVASRVISRKEHRSRNEWKTEGGCQQKGTSFEK